VEKEVQNEKGKIQNKRVSPFPIINRLSTSTIDNPDHGINANYQLSIDRPLDEVSSRQQAGRTIHHRQSFGVPSRGPTASKNGTSSGRLEPRFQQIRTVRTTRLQKYVTFQNSQFTFQNVACPHEDSNPDSRFSPKLTRAIERKRR